MTRFLWIFVCVAMAWGFTPAVFAQGNLSAKASLSTGVVKLGEMAYISLIVENADEVSIVSVPTVPGLELGQPVGPSRSSFMESRGGRTITRFTMQWKVPITPSKVGEFEFGPITLNINGKRQEVQVVPQAIKVVKDLAAAEMGFFEMPDRPVKIYEGQPFPLTMQLGWSRRLQVQKASLSLPWWNTQSGVLRASGPGFTEQYQNVQPFGVNRRFDMPFGIQPDLDVNGEPFRLFTYSTTLIATRPGTLEFPASSFLFAEVLERSRSQFRRPKMREYYITVDPFSIEVLPVPEKGRPFEWTGAVGEIAADRRLSDRDVTAGETMQLEVTWTGMANIEFFDAPDLKRLEAFEGFRVLGTEDTNLGMERRLVYELVPLSSEVTEIPPIPLWVFNPNTEAFEEVLTKAVPIRVEDGNELDLSGAFGEAGSGEEKRDLRDLHVAPIGMATPRGISSTWIWGLGGLIVLGWLVLRSLVRRKGDPASEQAKARRRAMGRLRKELGRAQSPEDHMGALHTYLGTRSSEAPEAWIGRNVLGWAEEQGWPSEAEPGAQRLQDLLRELDEAAFAGGSQSPNSGTIVNTVQDLAKAGVL